MFDGAWTAFCGFLLVFHPLRLGLGRRLGLLATVAVGSGLVGTSVSLRLISLMDFDWYMYSCNSAPDRPSFEEIRFFALMVTGLCWLAFLYRENHRSRPSVGLPLRNAFVGLLTASTAWMTLTMRGLEAGPQAGLLVSVGVGAMLFVGGQCSLAQFRATHDLRAPSNAF